MTRKEQIKELRAKAWKLEGQFNLHDYCDNALRQSWLDQAEALRKQADELEKACRQK